MATETATRKLNNKEVEETLLSVVQSLIDGQEGFETIGEHLKEESLRRFFAAESLQRAQFRGDIEEVLHQEGLHDVKEKGTLGGAMNRTWGDIKAHLGGGDPPCSRPPKPARMRRRRRIKKRWKKNCRCQSSSCSIRSMRIS